MRWIIVITAFAFAVVGTAPVSKAQTLAPATDPFNEKQHEAARISGQLVTGVQRRSAPDEALMLQAYIPAQWEGHTICSRVVSVDGLYEASNEYLVDAGWPGGLMQLLHPTKMPHMLRDRAADAVSVRVSPSRCDAEAEEATLAAWSGARDAPALLVNSFQAEAVFAYVEGRDLPVRCETVVLEGRSAYDMRCPLGDVDATGRVEVELLRIVGGKPAPQSRLFVWLP